MKTIVVPKCYKNICHVYDCVELTTARIRKLRADERKLDIPCMNVPQRLIYNILNSEDGIITLSKEITFFKAFPKLLTELKHINTLMVYNIKSNSKIIFKGFVTYSTSKNEYILHVTDAINIKNLNSSRIKLSCENKF